MVSTTLLQGDVLPSPLKVVGNDLEVVECIPSSSEMRPDSSEKDEAETIDSPTSAGFFPKSDNHAIQSQVNKCEDKSELSPSGFEMSSISDGRDSEENPEVKLEDSQEPAVVPEVEEAPQKPTAERKVDIEDEAETFNFSAFRAQLERKSKKSGVVVSMDDYRKRQMNEKKRNQEKKKEAAGLLNAGVAAASNLDAYHMKQRDEKRKDDGKKKEAASILNAGVAATSNLDEYHMKQREEKQKDGEKKKEATGILNAGVAATSNLDEYHMKQREEKQKDGEKKKEATGILNAGVAATSNLDDYHMKQKDEKKKDEERKKEAACILNAGVTATSNLDDYHMKQKDEKKRAEEKKKEAASILNAGVATTTSLDAYHMKQRDEKRKTKVKEEEAAIILRSYSGDRKKAADSPSNGENDDEVENQDMSEDDAIRDPPDDKRTIERDESFSTSKRLDLLARPERQYFSMGVFKCLWCKE